MKYLLILLALTSLVGCGFEPAPPTVIPTPALPTFTEVPPSPTSVPLPPPTATTSADKQFEVVATRWANRYNNAFTKFGNLSAEMKIGDQAWQKEIEQQLTEIEAINNEVMNYQPPPKYAAIYGDMKRMAGDFDQGATLFSKGLTTTDLTLIFQATDKFSQGATLLGQITADTKIFQP
ncbi:MAG: hypothetical protein M3014_08560 [Chloroflexota bacterium]|nr:hypothetical protein [Chloroflexota bacterium]